MTGPDGYRKKQLVFQTAPALEPNSTAAISRACFDEDDTNLQRDG